MTSAIKTAEVLASTLKFDPVAAALIQNTIPPDKLIELLNLGGYVKQQLAEAAKGADVEGFPEILRLGAHERRRQVLQEHFSLAHDDEHRWGELASAAAAYCIPPHRRNSFLVKLWPWSWPFWKPTPENRRRELVKAIALLVAEDQRLHRASHGHA